MKLTHVRPRNLIPVLLLCLAMQGCGPAYTKLAKGLFAISIGIDKVQKFNESSFYSGDIDRDTAKKINDDVIKALNIKKRANDLMAKIDPNNPAGADIDSVWALVDELAPIVDDMNQAGQLGIKNQASRDKFSLLITGITGGFAIVKGVKK